MCLFIKSEENTLGRTAFALKIKSQVITITVQDSVAWHCDVNMSSYESQQDYSEGLENYGVQ